MKAPSHTFLKRTAALHHGSKNVTAVSGGTTPGRGHEHRHSVPESPARTRPGVLLLVLLIAQLMVILDITAVNIALPSLAEDLQLTGSGISWTITSYSLIFGSLLLFGGRAPICSGVAGCS